jgi:hypothetical protein
LLARVRLGGGGSGFGESDRRRLRESTGGIVPGELLLSGCRHCVVATSEQSNEVYNGWSDDAVSRAKVDYRGTIDLGSRMGHARRVFSITLSHVAGSHHPSNYAQICATHLNHLPFHVFSVRLMHYTCNTIA